MKTLRDVSGLLQLVMQRNVCNGCGRPHAGGRAQCFKGPLAQKEGKNPHPDFNYRGDWATSTVGRAYKALSREYIFEKEKLNEDRTAFIPSL